MKHKKLFSLLCGIAIVVGCGHESADSPQAKEPVVFGPQFSPSKGLRVPDDTRQSLGLKVVEVSEQKVAPTVDIQLRVYEAGDRVYRAIGSVIPEQGAVLKQGQIVEVQSRNGKTTTGAVLTVSDRLQRATGTMEVLAEISGDTGEFSVGSFVRASIAVGPAQNVVTIPRAALLGCSDGHFVYTVSGEHFVRTPIKVGMVNPDVVEIRDGLYAGDQVVLQPVMSLWMTELAAVKGGQACCVEPAKGK